MTKVTGDSPSDKPCAGETWVGLDYRVDLLEITYEASTDRWQGMAALDVSMSYITGGSQTGIYEAELAFYDAEGALITRNALGDISWSAVPDSGRSTMSCGSYERGRVSEPTTFSTARMPVYIALWYSEIRTGVLEAAAALRYDAETTARPSSAVTATDWKSASVDDRQYYPPAALPAPSIGDGIESVDLQIVGRMCRSVDLEHGTAYGDTDIVLRGTQPLDNPQHIVGLERAELVDDGTTARVVIREYPYIRPPTVECDDAFAFSTVELSFAEEPVRSLCNHQLTVSVISSSP
ncbi:hypothetical protein [Halomarina rubra]|uniref:Uncharacterized protein n=1 Tax=Halomarina rubra TaxID=2071873 RepID=A0ABD6AZ24_9EURY|nr:hypothetical protein [Halomarina rubra]